MNNVNFVISQILGLTTAVITCLSFTMKSKKHFLLWGIVGDVIYGIAFIFVGSWSAGLIALTSCVQYLCSYLFERHNKKMPKILAVMFCIAFICLGVLTWQTAFDIIPLATYIWYTYVLYVDDVKKIRKMYVIPCIALTIYDISVSAFGSAVEDVTETTFLVVCITKDYVQAKKQAKALQNATLKQAHFGANKGIQSLNLQSIIKQCQTSINMIKRYNLSFCNIYLPHNKYNYPCLPHH